jgi:peptide/nickel transport system permease protein
MSGAKLIDGIKHGWAYILVVGTAGMAGLMRLMRANLLDELSKPYVKTARSKGLTERQLVWRYPVRLAMIPLASTIGFMLPALLSADVIVSVVLNVPTMGPVLLDALLKQDMILAGDILLIFGMLTVAGNILSDILLFWLDPRIQLDAGHGA